MPSGMISGMDDYPLLPVAEEVTARYRPLLEVQGWTVAVETNVVLGRVDVKLEHPLVPAVHYFGANSPQMTAERTRAFLTECFEDHYQFEVVRDAPVRPDRYRLLRHLRGAGTLHASDATCEAMTSAGYALYEEGILLREEADWLAEALQRDLEESGPRHSP